MKYPLTNGVIAAFKLPIGDPALIDKRNDRDLTTANRNQAKRYPTAFDRMAESD